MTTYLSFKKINNNILEYCTSCENHSNWNIFESDPPIYGCRNCNKEFKSKRAEFFRCPRCLSESKNKRNSNYINNNLIIDCFTCLNCNKKYKHTCQV